MSEKPRHRIAGPEHDLGQKYPDVARFLDLSGKYLSRNVYGCIDLAFRIIGFIPRNKTEVREFERVLKTMNDHKIVPQLIVPAAGDLRINVTDNASKGSPITWDDPDMEEEFL